MGKAGDPCERVTSAQRGPGRVSRRNSGGFRTAGPHASVHGTVYQPRAGGPGAPPPAPSVVRGPRVPPPTPLTPFRGPGASAALRLPSPPRPTCRAPAAPGTPSSRKLPEASSVAFALFLSPQPLLFHSQRLSGLGGSTRARGASDPAYSGSWRVLCCSLRDSLASRKRPIEPQSEPWSAPSRPVQICPWGHIPERPQRGLTRDLPSCTYLFASMFP